MQNKYKGLGFFPLVSRKKSSKVWSINLGKDIGDLLFQVVDTEFIGQSHKPKSMMINGMSRKRSFTSEVFKMGIFAVLERIRILILLQNPMKSKERFTSDFERWIKLLLLTNNHLTLVFKKSPHIWQYLQKFVIFNDS